MSGQKESFCSLLWRANGGSIDSDGRPINPNSRGQIVLVTDEDVELDEETAVQTGTERRYVRGMCTMEYPCTKCPLLLDELRWHSPDTLHWICPSCILEVSRTAKGLGRRLILPGYFAEGECTYRGCTRPPRVEEADGMPGVSSGVFIQTPPRFSRFLQLVIGYIY